MKTISIILIFINLFCFGQDTILIKSHLLIDKEIRLCNGSKNQLNCIDSLIYINLKKPEISAKSNLNTLLLNRYKKLMIYNYNAGFISGKRGNLEQAFTYFNISEKYLDSLIQINKDDEFKDFNKAIQYLKTDLCAETYFKDTTLFNNCNCAQFFPELSVEANKTETIREDEKKGTPLNNERKLFNELYDNDTLRINKNFVSDSISIAYFNLAKHIIINHLRQSQIYFEFFREPSLKIEQDTLIYKISINFASGSYERKCELVHSTSFQLLEDYFLSIFGNMELPNTKKNISFFIPLIVTPETPNNYNKMDKISIKDNHFLIEYEQLKPIEQH